MVRGDPRPARTPSLEQRDCLFAGFVYEAVGRVTCESVILCWCTFVPFVGNDP